MGGCLEFLRPLEISDVMVEWTESRPSLQRGQMVGLGTDSLWQLLTSKTEQWALKAENALGRQSLTKSFWKTVEQAPSGWPSGVYEDFQDFNQSEPSGRIVEEFAVVSDRSSDHFHELIGAHRFKLAEVQSASLQ